MLFLYKKYINFTYFYLNETALLSRLQEINVKIKRYAIKCFWRLGHDRSYRLEKVFDNGFEALKSVNFTIEQGDLVCLLGPSGCGKSTILNLIAGLLHPSDGDIQFRQQSVVKTAPKDRNIGFVFQNYALYPHMTVLENVMFPLTVGSKKVPKAEAQAIAEEYMKLTNIEELSHKSQAHFLVVNNSVLRLPGR